MSLDAVRRQKDRAAQLFAQGKSSAALEEYQRILKAVPGDVTVRQKVAELLQRAGRNAEAITEFSETVRRYAEAGHFFKATALCRVILGLDPKHEATQQQLAALYAARDPKGAPPKPPPAVEAPKLDVSSLSPVVPAVAPVTSDDAGVEIAVEDLIFEAEPPPPPKSELPSIPLFSSLDTEAFMALLKDAMDARVYAPGETVLKEGDPGDTMYALAQGTVEVLRDGTAVAEMHEGDFFGEMALLTGAPRLASIQAKDAVVLLAFPRAAMESLIARHPAVKVGLDNFFRERLLANVVRANPLFGALTPSQRWALSMAFTPTPFAKDQVLVEEFIEGREFTIGVFKTKGEIITLPITEVKSKKDFFDFEAKYKGLSEEITPAQADPAIIEKVQAAARKVYSVLNCRGVVRIDFIYNEAKGEPFMLEVNTVPGQSAASLIPQQVKAMGWTLEQFYTALIEECWN